MTTDIDPRGLIDHLVYGVTDLDRALDEIEGAIGVRPAEGGRHLGRGTRNHLLTLSDTAYLEVIGLDTENPADEGATVAFGLDQLDADRIVTWAIHPTDIDGVMVKGRRHNADHGKLHPMSRKDSEGNELHWQLAVGEPLPLHGLAPFYIDWGDSPHPTSTGLPRAELTAIDVTAPDPDLINRLYADLRLAQRAIEGPARITATISGPAGSLTLG